MRLRDRIRIGIVGAGWVGQEVARSALEDPRVKLVGIVDRDPHKAGRDLGELIGEGRLGLPIDEDLPSMLARARPEVAVVCTISGVEELLPVLKVCLDYGTHVVTTCESLADVDMAQAQLPAGFDEQVRDAGVVVLATGVNPGFAMDRLPVMLAQATRNIRRIRVSRVVDASTRRAQLQAKIGVGMTPHGFVEAIKDGEIGHVGLSSSLRLIAKGLGIPLDKTSEAFSPVLAASPTVSVLGAVPSGRVRGIYQIARGYRARREIITLELTMALDEETPRDTIDIVGEPPLHFEGELPGDSCTVGTVLSAISVVVTMPPGFRTVLEVPLEQPEEPESRESGSVLVPREATRLPHQAEAVETKPPEPTTSESEPEPPVEAATDAASSEVQVELPFEVETPPASSEASSSEESPAPEPAASSTKAKKTTTRKKKTTTAKKPSSKKKASTKKKTTTRKKKTSTKKKATKKKTAQKGRATEAK